MVLGPGVVRVEVEDVVTRACPRPVLRAALTPPCSSLNIRSLGSSEKRTSWAGVVGAAIVDHEKFEVAMGLIENRPDGRQDLVASIVGRHDDRGLQRGAIGIVEQVGRGDVPLRRLRVEIRKEAPGLLGAA